MCVVKRPPSPARRVIMLFFCTISLHLLSVVFVFPNKTAVSHRSINVRLAAVEARSVHCDTSTNS